MKKIILITRVSLLLVSSTLVYLVFENWLLVKTNLDMLNVISVLIVACFIGGTQLGVLLYEVMEFVTEYRGKIPQKERV
jgi:hypothetical protein